MEKARFPSESERRAPREGAGSSDVPQGSPGVSEDLGGVCVQGPPPPTPAGAAQLNQEASLRRVGFRPVDAGGYDQTQAGSPLGASERGFLGGSGGGVCQDGE